MKKSRFSRREFLQTSAGAAGATLAANAILLNSEPLFALTSPVAASDRVRFGIVGVGMEGSGLLTTAIQLRINTSWQNERTRAAGLRHHVLSVHR